MKTHNPFVTCQIHNIKLKADNAAMLVKGYDLVADCTGSPETLNILAPVCKELKVSLLSCIVDNQLIKLTLLPLSEKGNNLPPLWNRDENAQAKTHANTGAVYGIAGSIIANETLKFLLGKAAADNAKRITFDLLNLQTQTSNL
jgi:molybdopterin/thiamine biosynthesis adenylyltransferase